MGIGSIIEYACSKVGVDVKVIQAANKRAAKKLQAPGVIVWCYNSRLKTTAGMAYNNPGFDGGRIELSQALLARASEAENQETIIHETAHILADMEARRRCVHGPEWRYMMIRLGYTNPRRCHTINTVGLRRKQSIYRVACGCDTGCRVSAAMRTRRMKQLESGGSAWCRRCRSDLTLEDFENAERA
jgi:predicted SprT family Zn-dependent metalloprotease